jgi:hypothetical protein
VPTVDPALYVPIAPDPVNDPGNWREIDRLRKLAAAEGREFDTNDPYNWKGIAAAQSGAPAGPPSTAGTTPAGTTTEPGVTAPASTPGAASAVNDRNRALFDSMARNIQASGLAGLFTIGPDGAPSGRLWDQITSGMDSEAALIAWFEEQPEFQARFPAIAEARASGIGVVPTPAEVRRYEEEAQTLLRRAGLPEWFYDDPVNDLQTLMTQNISLVELQDRLGSAWTTVRETDPAVLDAFSQFFGVEGDAAMAAFFLDPERTQASLDRAARTAYTAGMGRNIGLDINQQLADRLASLPSTYGGIWEDLTSVAGLTAEGGVFTEGITETIDLTAEGTGIDAIVLGSGDAAAQMERRILRRQANSRSSLGGAAVTERGAVGVS